MKTKPNRGNKSSHSDAEIETAIHDALRAEGKLFPRNTQEVAELEATLKTTGVPTPDKNRFRAFLRAKVQGKIVALPRPVPAVSAEIKENLAVAARNGRKITDKIRRKMDASRENHEDRRSLISHGSC